LNELNKHDLLRCIQRMPKEVLALMKKNPNVLFLAGGFIRSCVTNEPVADVDLFVPTAELGKTLALELGEGDEKRVHTTQNALTVKRLKYPVQFITKWTYTSVDTLISEFDFTIACACIWFAQESPEHKGVWCSQVHPDYYADLASKRLIYQAPKRAEDAGGSMLRVLKFYQRGYRIPLDSLGAVIARLMRDVRDNPMTGTEEGLAKVVTGLLREVDPLYDLEHVFHLPSIGEGLTQKVLDADAKAEATPEEQL